MCKNLYSFNIYDRLYHASDYWKPVEETPLFYNTLLFIR